MTTATECVNLCTVNPKRTSAYAWLDFMVKFSMFFAFSTNELKKRRNLFSLP